MSITCQQHEAHARAVRRDHYGRTSRGLSVEIARLAFDNPIFGDDPAELLADLQRCAAACLASCLRDCRNEMKTADVFDRMVIQGRMNDIRRASALYSEFLLEEDTTMQVQL